MVGWVVCEHSAHRALDLEVGQADARLPRLRRLRNAQTQKGEQKHIGNVKSYYNLTCVAFWSAKRLVLVALVFPLRDL